MNRLYLNNLHGGLHVEVSIELDRNMRDVLYAATFVVSGWRGLD